MNLLDLNVDCLLKIFDYCSIEDLETLLTVDESLRSPIEHSIIKKKCSALLMSGSLANPLIAARYLIHLHIISQ